MLCNRSYAERYFADAECALDDCPYRDEFKPKTEPEPNESPLAKAVKEARGGPAPRDFRGFA